MFFMAKFLLRIKARKLRSSGESVKKIAKKLGVAKSTASLWVRDIILSVSQFENLTKRKLKGAELGRLRSALKQKERRLKLVETSKKIGIQELSNITIREFLIAGLALYWGEGTRKTREVKICNSDPKLINFIIKWLIETFKIKTTDLAVNVGINEIHRNREEIVKHYWSRILGIPLNQFRKTSFKKVKNKKVYENFNEHYGTCTITVLRSARIYYKIIGLIEGLYQAGSRLVSQGVS